MRIHLSAILSLILPLIWAATAGAQPTVTGVTGQWSHKGTVTMTGSGFGSKSTASPVVWDDASTGTILDKWDGAWPENNPTFNTAYRAPMRGVSLPHPHITRYIAGAHGDNIGPRAGTIVAFFKNRTIASFPAYTYVSWYQRADDAWVFGEDNNFKTFLVSAPDFGYEPPNYWYLSYNTPLPDSRTSTASYIFGADSAPVTLQFPDAKGNSQWWGEAVNPMSGAWTKVEMEIKYTSATDGYIKLWENGALQVDYAGPTDRMPGTSRSEGVGGYARMYDQPNNWRYFADVYLDYSRARVILGNAPTFDASTVREVQVPTSWSNSSISFAVNLGKFAEGQPAFLYVVNADGQVNAAGVPVIPVADTTVPTVSIDAPLGGSVVSGVVTVSAAATDNASVAGVQFRIGGVDVGAEDTTAPFTFTWNSATVPNGPHTLSAIARDVAGNQRVSAAVTVTTANKPAPTPNGLILAYGFDDGEGSIVRDSSGNDYPGAISGNPSWAPGRSGSALAFDGVDDLVTIAHAPGLDLSKGMTLEAWVQPFALSGWRTVLLKETTAGLAYAMYANDNTPNPAVTVNTGGTNLGATGTTPVPLMAWTHLAATYDGRTLRLFVDGTEAASREAIGSLVSSTGPLRIGGNRIWGEFFQGLIEDVRIYNRPLSAAEIRGDMATPVQGDPSEPPDEEVVLFGPRTYAGTGRPVLDVKTFNVTEIAGTHALRVTNHGVTAAFVALNGRLVLGPRDFRKAMTGHSGGDDDRWEPEWDKVRKGEWGDGDDGVSNIDIPIRVRAGSNQIVAGFWARKGRSFTMEVVRTSLSPPPAFCEVTSPVDGSTVMEGEPIVVRAEPVGQVRTTQMRFRSSDGSLHRDDRSAPYKVDYVVPLGVDEVTFTVTAFDRAGNTSVCSSTVQVTPQPPPTVAITSPVAGLVVREGATIRVKVAASGHYSVSTTSLAVNGFPLSSAPAGVFEFLVTVPSGVGALTLGASAVDEAGRTGTAADVIVTVAPDPLTTVRGRLVDKSNKQLSGADAGLEMNGVVAEIFDFTKTLTSMPSLYKKTPNRTKMLSAINLRNPGFLFGTDPFGFGTTSHAVRLTGYIRTTKKGLYKFILGVNGGGRLIVGGETLVNLRNDGGMFQQAMGYLWLAKGETPLQLLTFDNGNPEIQLSYALLGQDFEVVPPEALVADRAIYVAKSGAGGLFSVPNVPTVLGPIGAFASFQPPRGNVIEGTAVPIEPVVAGVTDLGTIKLK